MSIHSRERRRPAPGLFLPTVLLAVAAAHTAVASWESAAPGAGAAPDAAGRGSVGAPAAARQDSRPEPPARTPDAAGPAEGSAPAAAPAAVATRATPATVFEEMKRLAGTWIGRSTKGWEEEVTLKVIAGGSVLVASSFDAHPGEEMLTTWYMDGDELQLRHYCIARNQPRLAATEISADGREITFTFKDATNLPSRDRGHMDKAVYRLEDEDSFSSQWTWYQDGRESWMEKIDYRRVR